MFRVLITYLFICLAINQTAYAQSACNNPVFGVSRIEIDRRAETANDAQRLSLQEAHQSAFQTVLRRLLIDEADFASDIIPESLVELVHIRTETSLPKRYIAVIDICFAPEAMRALFIENQRSWAEVRSPRILVMPVFSNGAGVRAWQTDHPWIETWHEVTRKATGLLDYTLLESSLQNERQIRAERLFAADEAILARAAERAKAEQLLMVRAVISLIDDTPQLVMNALIFDKEGALIGPVFEQDLQGEEQITQQAFDGFVKQVQETMEQGWQKANLRQEGVDNQLIVRVVFNSHDEWIAKQTKLKNLPAIESLSTLLISTSHQDNMSQSSSAHAIVSLKMNGSIEALGYGLSPLGLSLSEGEDMAVID